MVETMKQSRLSLNDVEWKNFNLEEIFQIVSVKGKTISKYTQGKTPYISTSNQNNAVSGFVNSDQSISKGQCISVDPIAGKCFYHPYEFVGRGGAGSAINLLYNSNLNKHNAQFIVSSIEKASKEKASYGIALNGKRLKTTKINLPVDKNGKPHWEYMSQFMRKLEKDIAQKVISYYEQKMLEASFDLVGLEGVEWKNFSLEEIFQIVSVKGKTISKYTQGKTPYISTSNQNNAVSGFVNSDQSISKGQCISVDPIAGKCFYHPYEFVGRGGAGSAINLLYNSNLNKHNAQFIVSSIEKASKEKASYGIALNGKRLKTTKIILPVDKNGKPYWDYMSQFMRKLEKEKIQKLLTYIYIYIG